MRFKDVVPLDFQSHLIYQFKCPSCNAGYIGETREHFITRSSQHLGISEFTGKTRKITPSAVLKHLRAGGCEATLSDFTIIGKEQNFHNRLTKESLFIKLHDYELNEKKTSVTLHLFWLLLTHTWKNSNFSNFFNNPPPLFCFAKKYQ